MSTMCDRCGNARCGLDCENWESEQNLAYSLANPTLPFVHVGDRVRHVSTGRTGVVIGDADPTPGVDFIQTAHVRWDDGTTTHAGISAGYLAAE